MAERDAPRAAVAVFTEPSAVGLRRAGQQNDRGRPPGDCPNNPYHRRGAHDSAHQKLAAHALRLRARGATDGCRSGTPRILLTAGEGYELDHGFSLQAMFDTGGR
jgi:hypothetical protein